MTYCTKSDMDDFYGEDFVIVISDRDNSGTADTGAISAAISRAESKINSYLVKAGEPLPLPSVPEEVKGTCMDIAVYYLANRADRASEDIHQRYKDAVVWLKSIAKGEAGLGFASASDEPVQTAQEASSFGTRLDRRFTRGAMDKLL